MTEMLRLISTAKAAERLSLTRSSIYRLLKDDPSFPRPVKIAFKRIAFVEAEIDNYIQHRLDARHQPDIKAVA